MNGIFHRRDFLRAGLALCASLAVPSARACEFYTTTLRITHPWTRASQPGATSAVISMKIDEVTEADRLIGVECPLAAGAELVRAGVSTGVDLHIPKGRETLLEEAGTHIRLIGLKQPLELARAYPLKLVFEKGGAVEVDLSTDYEDVCIPQHEGSKS